MIHCHFCRGEMTEQLTTFLHEVNGQVQIVRHVPAFVCSQCGEKEYSPETTHRILAFIKEAHHPAEILHVPAYDMAITG